MPATALARRRITAISPTSISPTLRADRRSAAAFLADGEAPPVGAAIVQPDLARTLEEIAADGAECFYRGALARRLAAGCADGRRPGRRGRSRRVRGRAAGADRDRLSRLHRARGAAQLDRLRAARRTEDRREFRSQGDGARLGRSGACHGRGEEARLRRPRALGRRPALASMRRSPSCCRPTTPRGSPPASTCTRAAPTRSIRRRGRRHDLFLHRRRRRQRRLRHPEHQQRLGLRRDGRRHRHPAEQPHGLLAPRAGPSELPAAGPPGAAHDEPAAGAEGRRAVGGLSARPAPTTRCRSISRC